MAEAYIVAAARTAGGRKGGRLAGWHPADLAASVLDELVARSGAAPDQIEDVIMGCVMQAGEQSNNVARNAIMASKLPESVPGTSIDRQCVRQRRYKPRPCPFSLIVLGGCLNDGPDLSGRTGFSQSIN